MAREMGEFLVTGVAQGYAFVNELCDSRSSINVVKLNYRYVGGGRLERVGAILPCCRQIFSLCPDVRELVVEVPLNILVNLVTPPSNLQNLQSLTITSNDRPIVPTDSTLDR